MRHVACDKCRRKGRYALARLIEQRTRYGKVIDWLAEITSDCRRTKGDRLPLPLVWLLFYRLDMTARWTLVGDQFEHRTHSRHAADGRRAFAQTGAVLRQVMKLG